MRLRCVLLVTALILSGCKPAVATAEDRAETAKAFSPELAGRVTDAAHILKPEQVQSLTSILADFEARTHHQMVVVTVPSLNGQDVADYTQNLANQWGIGRKGINDGIVVLVAPKERKVRIAVGYGLENRLSNAYCQNVIDTLMIPKFRAASYYDGLMAAVVDLGRSAI